MFEDASNGLSLIKTTQKNDTNGMHLKMPFLVQTSQQLNNITHTWTLQEFTTIFNRKSSQNDPKKMIMFSLING